MKPRVAAYVLFGLVMAWGLVSFFLLDGLLFFPGTLPLRPIAWWRAFSWVTVLAFFGGLTAAAVAEPWMKHAKQPDRVWKGLLSATLALIALGQTGEMFGGVAVFPDRIERRDVWPWSPLETLNLADIRRVEVGCVYNSRGKLDPIYRIVLGDGRDESLSDGDDTPLGRERWLDAMLAVDHAAREGGAAREISSNIFGYPNESSKCVGEFAASFAPGREGEVRRLMEPLPYP